MDDITRYLKSKVVYTKKIVIVNNNHTLFKLRVHTLCTYVSAIHYEKRYNDITSYLHQNNLVSLCVYILPDQQCPTNIFYTSARPR